MNFVVAYDANVHRAFAEVERDLVRWPEVQVHGFGWNPTWLDHGSGTCHLPRVFSTHGNRREAGGQLAASACLTGQ